MKKTLLQTFTSLTAALLLTACGSTGLGDILGGGGSNSPVQADAVVRGTVDRVDTSNRTIVLRDASTVQSNLRNNSGSNTIYLEYDQNTYVEYAGERYAPSALEVGDRIEARTVEVGNRLVAEQIRVTYDVSGGGTTGSGNAALTEMRAIVQSVDTRNRVLTVERDSWSSQGQTYRVAYDTNTPVYWQGRTYGPQNLERGDVIDLDLRTQGNTMIANRIDVVQSASSNANAGFRPDVRGTVQRVDTSARTLTIERPTWMNNFNSTSGNTLTLRYDANTPVLYNGQTYTPANLERGDQIEIEVRDSGNVLLAEEILVVSNVRNSSY